ncbi:hypothetical protein LINGRAHAP2_LOCUS3189 [Linum grandiflorum]
MVMKKNKPVVVAGEGDLQNLLTLADTATAVGACGVCCGFCSHSDPEACFSTVTKRNALLETHLFLHRPIRKSSTKGRRSLRRNPLRRCASPSTIFFDSVSHPEIKDFLGVTRSESLAKGPRSLRRNPLRHKDSVIAPPSAVTTASESMERKKITLVIRRKIGIFCKYSSILA